MLSFYGIISAPSFFIAKNTNRSGKRYGFVRFKGVGDVGRLERQLEERTWLNNAWVGILRNLVMFDRVEDELMWDRGEYITSKYLGDDMVLLLGLTDSKAEQLCKEATDNELSLFHKVKK